MDRATNSSFSSGLVSTTLAAGTTSYSSTGLSANTTYYYRVRAINGAGSSANSNPASATTQGGVAVPNAPSNLAATAASATQINLTWTDNSSNETGFKIDRSTSSTFATSVTTTTVAAGSTTYSATGLTAGSTYYFRVRATNSAGDSGNSGPASATTFSRNTISLAATAASGTEIDLAWTAYSGAAGYRVEISSDGMTFYGSALLDASYTTAQAVEFEPGMHRYFRVVAYNNSGDLAISSMADATTTGSGANLAQVTNAPAQNISTATPQQTLVVPINGADLSHGNNPPYGNRWFKQINQEVGGSIKSDGGVYLDEQLDTVLTDLYAKLDVNGDKEITASEIAGFKIKFVA